MGMFFSEHSVYLVTYMVSPLTK